MFHHIEPAYKTMKGQHIAETPTPPMFKRVVFHES